MVEKGIPHNEEETSLTAIPTEKTVFDEQANRQLALLSKLEAGVDSVLTSEGFSSWLRMVGKFHAYSFANTMLIMTQRPDATMVNSFDRWKQLGRHVKKRPAHIPPGEYGIKVFYPKTRWVKDIDPDTGDERRHKILTGYGVGNVWDISDTEGEPLPEPPKVTENTGTDDTAMAVNLKLSRFLMDEGIRLSSEPMHGSKRGYWDPNRRLIAIRSSTMVSPLAISPTRTLTHEAAHYLADHRGQVDRRDAECVAEGAAYATLAHFGVDVGEMSFSYIAGWSQNRDVLRRNLSEVQKVSTALITAIEGVCNPYSDGFGSFEKADPWAAVREELKAEEELMRIAPNL